MFVWRFVSVRTVGSGQVYKKLWDREHGTTIEISIKIKNISLYMNWSNHDIIILIDTRSHNYKVLWKSHYEDLILQ